ncbi:DNA repair protein SWI5 homolog [Micropterus salmoides]|uniref:DNA repair protein SWI5 homolog n=1 Tax=Micropterus salmoides TaxID=27706 RepID=UPI0018ED78FA|nr:DNA repair protein SWI5 homolog [Micropterus salmoides]XP_038589577.1 DNA repair protein SWI5 homolog [Micropterus salmoides]
MNTEQSAETHCSANNCPVSTPEGNDLQKGALKRTPFSKFKRVHTNFKSPLQVTESAKVSPTEEVAELQRRREQLDTEIAQLEAEGYRVEELEHHIDMLHEYNDIKDIGQSLLGRIAALRGTTTRDLYSHFGLELDD